MPKLHVNIDMMSFHGAMFAAMLSFLCAVLMAGCGNGSADTFSLEGVSREEGMEAVPDGGMQIGGSEEDGGSTQASSEESGGMQASDGTTETETAAVLYVHICGAVEHPDVYGLPEGSRVIDAVRAAGGFAADAAGDACNLAAPVSDGCRIYIMTEEEFSQAQKESTDTQAGYYDAIQPVQTELAGTAGNSASSDAAGTDGGSVSDTSGKINLNTADESALMTLPGIGEAKAQAILAYREAHGNFQKIEDVMKVSGIKQAAFEKIKEKITV